ncbi:MAG: hypothetical protein AB7P03_13950 [Kofleriaceae bacterium]
MKAMRQVAALAGLALVGSMGCAARCPEVARQRAALASRTGMPDRAADLRVRVPLERANEVIAELLAAEPLTAKLEVPDLRLLRFADPLSASVRSVTLAATEPERVRFAVELDVDGSDSWLEAMTAIVEVEPRIERVDGGCELVIGVGPENLVSVTPRLGPQALARLAGAITRGLPGDLRRRLPAGAVAAAAASLGNHLTGAAYRALRATLLTRVGEVSRVRFRLPDVPIASTAIRSEDGALIVELLTDLPVRRGLERAQPDERVPTTRELSVQMTGSAAAELANWAIDEGHAPRWFDRGLAPRPRGEYRPRFDYIAEDQAHPIKVFVFQERGGCSYFRMGVAATLAVHGDELEVTATDRKLEDQCASPLIEAVAWTKYFLFGWIDRSRRAAAHTRLVVGGHVLETRVVHAALADDELAFELVFGERASIVASRPRSALPR